MQPADSAGITQPAGNPVSATAANAQAGAHQMYGAADGGALAGIGAVEGTEDRFRLAADFVGVDHAALVVGREGLDGIEAAEAAALIEKIEATAMHLQIELAADGEHRVADGLGFETVGVETPEIADVGVDLNRR